MELEEMGLHNISVSMGAELAQVVGGLAMSVSIVADVGGCRSQLPGPFAAPSVALGSDAAFAAFARLDFVFPSMGRNLCFINHLARVDWSRHFCRSFSKSNTEVQERSDSLLHFVSILHGLPYLLP